MTVDFAFKKAPKYRVACLSWKGPWNEKRIRSKFGEVARWAKKNGFRTGKWIFREPADRTWEVCVEVQGKGTRSAGARLKTLRAATVASVVFDPDVVSPRVVYHGMSDWLKWRRKEKEIKSVRSTREVYDGDPWTNAKAWARTDVQFVVTK